MKLTEKELREMVREVIKETMEEKTMKEQLLTQDEKAALEVYMEDSYLGNYTLAQLSHAMDQLGLNCPTDPEDEEGMEECVEKAEEWLGEHLLGTEGAVSYSQQLLDDGVISDEQLEMYFDHDSFARDLRMAGDISVDDEGNVYSSH